MITQKMHQINFGTSQLLTLGGTKKSLWIFSALSGQVLRRNNFFSAERKSKCHLNKQEYDSSFLLMLPVWFLVQGLNFVYAYGTQVWK